MASESSTSQSNPTEIGPYAIEGLMDKGGMSLLYYGLDPKTHARIIVKTLSQKFLSNPEVVSRFLKEAEIIQLADHPNIIKLFGFGEWKGGLFIAMEYIQGTSLRQYLQKTPLSLKRALEIILEIAYALCHLHTHHIIHRDVKPENILITLEGKVKVIDFGIAQLLYSEDFSPDEKMRFIGTPIYMSPEQREEPKSASYPSDIYSLGIIAYELILGRISQGQIHLSLLPKGLQKILAHALYPNLQERYSDIVDFISDLSNYLHSESFEKEKRVQDHLIEDYEALILQLKELLNPPSNIPNLEITLKPGSPQFKVAWFFTPQGVIILEAKEASLKNFLPLLQLKGSLKKSMEDLEEYKVAYSRTVVLQNHFWSDNPYKMENGLLDTPFFRLQCH